MIFRISNQVIRQTDVVTHLNCMFKLFRKKPTEITQKDEWNTTLEKMLVILRDNSHSSQADWVRKIHGSLYRNDITDFIKKLNSVDMWGGSGAVWEVGRFNTLDEEKDFGRQIVRLEELMKTNRISHGKAKSVARYFRKEFNLR
jgi:hypothetical protein